MRSTVACLAVLALAPVGAAASGPSEGETSKAPTWAWTPGPLVGIFKEADYGDKADTVCLIRLVASRGGTCSGQVVVCSAKPLAIVGAAASDLKHASADATIAGSQISTRYALPTGSDRYAGKRFPGVRQPGRFDALADAPGPPATIQPVWVTVTVPRAARSGDYSGQLAVRPAEGKAIEVPIRLTVCSWGLPEPQDFRTHVGFVQSPDSLAIQYRVPPWSKRHFDLITRSFHYLGLLGNKTLYVPLLAQTHFGNEQSMVRWIRKPDGTYAHDFSVMETYLDLYLKHAVKPDIVIFYVWDYSIGGAWWGNADKRTTPQPVPVSRLDLETGTVELMHGPVHGAPESEAFWKPVMDGVRERLAKRGLGDEAMLLGIGGDKRPDKATVELFKKVAPHARWVSNSHGKVLRMADVPVSYLTVVWGAGIVPPPETKRNYGWRNPLRITVFPRYGGGKFVIHPHLSFHAPLPVYRNICEGATLADRRGLGRLGVDFWRVLHGRRGKKTILNRYPAANWAQLTITNAVAEMVHPGPDGPIATVRFEMFREGLQEAEARIFVERALTTPNLRATLPDDLATRCQDVLDERVRTYLRAHGNLKTAAETNAWFARFNWHDRTAQLFNLAGDVEKALPADR